MRRTRRDTTVARVVAAVLALNLVAWGLFGAYAYGGAAAAAFVSAGSIAYVLGMRHAFDADHLAAIDDTTRLLVSRGRRPVGLGLGFAAGHSLVVLVLCVVVAVAAGTTLAEGLLGGGGGRWTTALAAAFLLLVGVLNLGVLRRVWRARQLARAGAPVDPDASAPGGLATWLLGRRALARVDSGWHMVPVGLLFGLGMETASEVALLGLSASAGVTGGLPLWAVLALPLLFAAGMATFDTLDSLMMTRLYSSPAASGTTRLTLNATMTAITAAIGLGIGAVYLAECLEGSVVALRPLASVGEHAEQIGWAIVAVYACVWAAIAVQARREGAALVPADAG